MNKRGIYGVSILLGVVLLMTLPNPAISGDDPGSSIVEVDVQTAYKMITSEDSLIVIDLRSEIDYHTGHISKAVSIEFFGCSDCFLSRMQDYRVQSLLLYCADGEDSKLASDFLLENGYTPVHILKGGFAAWVSQGLTVEQSLSTEDEGDYPRVPEELPTAYLEDGFREDRSDNDLDGLLDSLEDTLLRTYAPVVLLHDYEPYKPCNVNWFLERSHMRFHHSDSCDDCSIIDHGYPRQDNIINREHRKKDGWPWCDHNNNWEHSWYDFDDDHCFFLQVYDTTHYGSSNPADWIVYGHTYPNNFGGINLQYWFFYAYSMGWNGIGDHEGDWENINVELRYNDGYEVEDVVYYQHNEPPHLISPMDVTWYDTTHPIVLSAFGTHASYPDFDSCIDEEMACDGCPIAIEQCSNAWFTWVGGKPVDSPGYQGGGVLNVGERNPGRTGHLNNQMFIHYSAGWGEIGAFGCSGPRGPAYQGERWGYHSGGSNYPPYIPSDPDPSCGENIYPTGNCLCWDGGDPDSSNIVTYDVYFGTDPENLEIYTTTVPFPADQTFATCEMPPITYGRTYYWSIVARDSCGVETCSTGTWWFSTQPRLRPFTPAGPYPEDGWQNYNVQVDLWWRGGDPNPTETVTYDIYFGTVNPPGHYAQLSNRPASEDQLHYELDALNQFTWYYWQIIATDSFGLQRIGPVWSFRTGSMYDEYHGPCFLNGTAISMADGSVRNIEDVRVGDLIMAYNEINHRLAPGRVTEVFHHTSTEMGAYYLVINNHIQVTPNHLLYVNNHWVLAGKIRLGDCLHAIDGAPVLVTSIMKVFKQVSTYNLEIEPFHNYFAEGILAHNKPPGFGMSRLLHRP